MSTENPAPLQEAAASAPPPPDRMTAVASRFESIVLRRALIIGALILLVMIGLFLSNFAITEAKWYWAAMFPVFGIACVWHELAGGAARVIPLWRILLRQALHWLIPIIAVRIIFLQHERGLMSADSVAMVILVLLAVTCFLAGVHFDHSFIWVSIVLGIAAILGTEVETYLWLVAVLAALALGVAILSSTLLRRRRGVQAPTG